MEQYVQYYGQQPAYEDVVEDVIVKDHVQRGATHDTSGRSKSTYLNSTAPQPMSCEIKPRLTKEQHDVLEAHFQKQNKPNTNTKKQFAENLSVSLEKVNNWFQNRRAKSKTVAKKVQAGMDLYQAQQGASQYNTIGSGSDSDTSPSFTSPDYLAMMQQCAPEQQQQMNGGLGISEMQPYHEQRQMHGLPLSVPADAFQSYATAQNFEGDAFNSPEQMNRRTITQEQFDAFARGGAIMPGSDDFNIYQNEFARDSGVWGSNFFPGMQNNDLKQQDAFAFPHPAGAPLSSYDSTVPSTISDQSVPGFPSSNQMQNQHFNQSASSSEWSGSRSSSVCVSQPGDASSTSTSQWRPGQSVPVDFDALNEEFRQAAQSRDRQMHSQEQPLAWLDDNAYGRRDSQTTMMLANGMSNVGIHAHHPSQLATFKSPAPPANIAARRQRRPAPIGLGAMRSQSYTNPSAPGSPSQVQQQSLAPSQQVRRIRSSNAVNGINGGVATGRVVKKVGLPQRSPLNWTFADAINSPRHVSGQSSLAPHTPMTPQETTGQEDGSLFSTWQAASGQAARHPSINETDIEHDLPYQPSASVPAQQFSSPPHTPSYYQQQFVQQRMGNNFPLENTPPQSAPASQMCFPSSTFVQQQQAPPAPPPQQQPQQFQQQQQQQVQHQSMFQPWLSQQPAQQLIQPMPTNQTQQHVSAAPTNPPMQTVTFAPTQHAPVTSGPPPGVPLQFANGVPIVDDDGNITMAFPAPIQFVPEPQHQQQPPVHMRQPPLDLHTPPHHPYQAYTSSTASTSSATPSPNMHILSNLPKQPPQPPNNGPELFVHEYSPPEELKRAATPRKGPAEVTGPKNYVFANSGPESWEKQAAGRKAAQAANGDVKSNGGPNIGAGEGKMGSSVEL